MIPKAGDIYLKYLLHQKIVTQVKQMKLTGKMKILPKYAYSIKSAICKIKMIKFCS